MKPMSEWTTEELTNRLDGRVYDTRFHDAAPADVLAELLRRERERCVAAIRRAQEPRQDLYRLYGHKEDLQRCGGMMDAIEAIEGLK
jgi:hypothetical protein